MGAGEPPYGAVPFIKTKKGIRGRSNGSNRRWGRRRSRRRGRGGGGSRCRGGGDLRGFDLCLCLCLFFLLLFGFFFFFLLLFGFCHLLLLLFLVLLTMTSPSMLKSAGKRREWSISMSFTTARLNLDSLATQNDKLLGTLRQETRELIHQHTLHFVDLLDDDADANGV